ncbi:Cof-type HAD-IIB family hydrolase [Fervidobacterium islandicum]|uniref:Cof-type HAD-IIB family hydrolase n=1 Tax=Fervidobacterium islandicum TaxID=2423 RepID=A0AAI8CNE2_FERIS|nr:HAD family hydrolase [Fervidobacterium islandicum]AMW33413.1 Cof-type HAD-IIB family hydrolase [Fervidobacterium islandicum]
MVKLIVTDLDGTLLNDEKHIPKENIEVLRAAMEKGIHVSVATGRNFYSAKPYVEELGLDVPVIFQNGAFIYQWMENKIIYKSALGSEIATKVIETARRHKLFYILYRDFLEEKDMYIDMPYTGSFSLYLGQNQWRLNIVDDVLKYIKTKDAVAEVALVGEELVIRQAINEALDGLESQTSVVKNTTIGNETFYEIFGPNSSKELSIKHLFEYFKVAPEETMYLGDSFNDIGLLKMVGYPIVMENGHDEVKQYARYITKSNNEAGVAYAVKKWALGIDD